AKDPSKAYPVGIIQGLATDPNGVAGKLRELERVDDTRVRIRNFTASQLPTIAPSDSWIEIGDPGYWFDSDVLAHIDGIRELCGETWPTTAAEDIPTTLIVPNKRTKTSIHSQSRELLLRIPGRRPKVSV